MKLVSLEACHEDLVAGLDEVCCTIQNSIGDFLMAETGSCDYSAGTDTLEFRVDDISLIPIPQKIKGNLVDVVALEFCTQPLFEIEGKPQPATGVRGGYRVTL